MTTTPHLVTREGNIPLLAQTTRIVPMPKRLAISRQTIRTLATGSSSGILTDLDVSTLALRNQARNLPIIHTLVVASMLSSLGYTQRHAKGHPSELCFIDPELNLVRTICVPDACTGFASGSGQWIVACRDGRLYCFDRVGNIVWTWMTPRDRHFKSPVFLVAANEHGIFAAEGPYLYALSPRGELLWDWELPGHPQESRRLHIPNAHDSLTSALKTLELGQQPTPKQIRLAHRRMARLTHPDLNPDDEMASARFRSVQQAYEYLQKETSRAWQSRTITISLVMRGPSARITALQVQDAAVAIGSSKGEVYLFDAAGKVQSYHPQLGQQPVYSVLLRDGRLDAAFCYPRLYRFGSGSPVASEDLKEYFVTLTQHTDR